MPPLGPLAALAPPPISLLRPRRGWGDQRVISHLPNNVRHPPLPMDPYFTSSTSGENDTWFKPLKILPQYSDIIIALFSHESFELHSIRPDRTVAGRRHHLVQHLFKFIYPEDLPKRVPLEWIEELSEYWSQLPKQVRDDLKTRAVGISNPTAVLAARVLPRSPTPAVPSSSSSSSYFPHPPSPPAFLPVEEEKENGNKKREDRTSPLPPLIEPPSHRAQPRSNTSRKKRGRGEDDISHSPSSSPTSPLSPVSFIPHLPPSLFSLYQARMEVLDREEQYAKDEAYNTIQAEFKEKRKELRERTLAQAERSKQGR